MRFRRIFTIYSEAENVRPLRPLDDAP